MDAVIVHTRHGAELLGGGRAGARDPPRRVRPPHAPARRAAAPARARGRRGAGGAVLRGRASVQGGRHAGRGVPRRRRARSCGSWGGRSACRPRRSTLRPNVRFVPRYVADAELPAYFRRADLLVLPHREVDVSGVLFAGLAFGKPMVLSDVGGFREVVEEHGAGRLVPPGDAGALREAIARAARRPRGARAARAARPRGRGRPLLVGLDRRAYARPSTPRCSHEGRLHGQGQGLVGARARLAGRARRGRRGRRRARAESALERAAPRPRPPARLRGGALRRPARRTSTWSSPSCSGT